jgi:hypothetical protein
LELVSSGGAEIGFSGGVGIGLSCVPVDYLLAAESNGARFELGPKATTPAGPIGGFWTDMDVLFSTTTAPPSRPCKRKGGSCTWGLLTAKHVWYVCSVVPRLLAARPRLLAAPQRQIAWVKVALAAMLILPLGYVLKAATLNSERRERRTSADSISVVCCHRDRAETELHLALA